MLIPSIGIRLAVLDVSTGIITLSRLTNTSSLTLQFTASVWNTSGGSSWSTVFDTTYPTSFYTQWATTWNTNKSTSWNTDKTTAWNTSVTTAKPTVHTSFFGTSIWTDGAVDITHAMSRDTNTEWQIGIVRTRLTDMQHYTAKTYLTQPMTLTGYLTGWLTDYGGFSLLTEVGTYRLTAAGTETLIMTEEVTEYQCETTYIETVFKNTLTATNWESIEVGSGWQTDWDTIVENTIYTNTITDKSTSTLTEKSTATLTSVSTAKLTNQQTSRNTTKSTSRNTSNASVWETNTSTNTEWTTQWDTATEWTTSN